MLRLVFVMALLVGLLLAVAPAQATTWDLATDWSGMNSGASPWICSDMNVVWGPYFGLWNQYNTHTNSSPFDHWNMNNNYIVGEVVKNTGAAGNTLSGAVFDAGEIGLSVGAENVWGEAQHKTLVRWTAPENYDQLTINAKFSQLYAGGDLANVSVLYYVGPPTYDTTTLFSDSLDGYRGNPTTGYSDAFGTHNTTAWGGTTLYNVLAGQTLDFLVQEPTGVHSYSNETGLSVTITNDVPEPGSMLALGSGLVGMLGFAIRRRRA